MKTRIFYTKFWKDPYVHRLTPSETMVYVYLLTNDKVNIINCYEVAIDEIVYDIKLSQAVIRDTLGKLQRDGKIAVLKDWVFLTNANKYQRYSGRLNEVAKSKVLEEMPKSVLGWYNKLIDRGIEGVYIPSINHKSEIRDKKLEIRNQKSEREIVKRESFSRIEDIQQSDMQEIAGEYGAPLSFVMSKLDDMKNHVEGKGIEYKNYKAMLKTWVKKDAMDLRKEADGRSKIAYVGEPITD